MLNGHCNITTHLYGHFCKTQKYPEVFLKIIQRILEKKQYQEVSVIGNTVYMSNLIWINLVGT